MRLIWNNGADYSFNSKFQASTRFDNKHLLYYTLKVIDFCRIIQRNEQTREKYSYNNEK